jgi:hypothetical protein
MSAEKSEFCERHPGERLNIRCERFHRRFCDLDFAGPDRPECKSPDAFCKFRQQCVVWARLLDETGK